LFLRARAMASRSPSVEVHERRNCVRPEEAQRVASREIGVAQVRTWTGMGIRRELGKSTDGGMRTPSVDRGEPSRRPNPDKIWRGVVIGDNQRHIVEPMMAMGFTVALEVLS